KTIKSLPLTVAYEKPFEVRGEIFMKFSDFEKLEGFANPRNAAAGSLKLLDSKITESRNLSIFIYDLFLEKESLASQWEKIIFLEKEGFPVIPNSELCSKLEDVFAFCKNWNEARKSLDYPTDGAVFKLNSVNYQQELGATSKFPRWAIAYKFAADIVETIVKEIKIEVGRTGTLTPVAELEPVLLSGSTVSRASLHNFDQLERLGVRVGDFVNIRKAGEIIPEVIEVNLKKRDDNTTIYVKPTHCPSCGSPIQKEESEVAIKCPNQLLCPAQNQRRIEHWASKNAADIKGLGESIIELFIEKKLILGLADIYSIDPEKILALEGFKEKSVSNLMKSIEDSKKIKFERFIYGLGIKYVGLNTAKLLASEYENLEDLKKSSQEALA
ncbi:MAG TPA: NAD-dependent DNA ligase LigA, partial [Vampirovibrionales bacterium]